MEKIAYVDECGIDTFLHRNDYAARGQKVFSRISGRKYTRCGVVAARSSTVLGTFGLGANDSFKEFSPLVLLLTMPCLILFNFGDYT